MTTAKRLVLLLAVPLLALLALGIFTRIQLARVEGGVAVLRRLPPA